MRLDYLPDGSPDCPLVRIFGFTPSEIEGLHASIVGLASGERDHVDVHSLPGIEATGDARLTLWASPWDESMSKGPSPTEFRCDFTRERWDNVAGLVAPFLAGSPGHQWLATGGHDSLALLLSVDGSW